MKMEKYRNQFRFFGLKSPARRILEKEVLKTHKMALQDRAALVGVFPSLWEQEERDFQYLGCFLLEQHRKLLLGSSDEEFLEAMETVKLCISTKSWWDTVDMLASHGEIVIIHEHVPTPPHTHTHTQWWGTWCRRGQAWVSQ